MVTVVGVRDTESTFKVETGFILVEPDEGIIGEDTSKIPCIALTDISGIYLSWGRFTYVCLYTNG